MTLTLVASGIETEEFRPRIMVIGVGGGGTNAVNGMVRAGLDDVELVVANTDAKSLRASAATRRVQMGAYLTEGLGAGMRPEIGRAAAEESLDEILAATEGCHMLFVVAGMGGGTGTGAAPVVARAARERGVLTIGVVTKPFDFEGKRRRELCEAGVAEMQRACDTLIVVPNQNLFRTVNARTSMLEAFAQVDGVLHMGIKGVTDLVLHPGQVNLDFADIRTAISTSQQGRALMGLGEASGEGRAQKAAEDAMCNPLVEEGSVKGAQCLMVNITGADTTLFEFEEIVSRISKEVGEGADVMFGMSTDAALGDRIRVSVVATGIGAPPAAAASPVAEAQPPAPPKPQVVHTAKQPPVLSQPPQPDDQRARLQVPTFLRRQTNG